MYKALIVDDEIEIREGLKSRFPWKELGVSEVATAENAEEAYHTALRIRPDIILTDISMGRVSGLDFLERLQESGMDAARTIVITGYDDFHYAKRAIRLGTVDYLLKPVNTNELRYVVTKALMEIDQSRNQTRLVLELDREMPRMREEFIQELIHSEWNPFLESKTMQRLHSIGLDWMTRGTCSLLLCEVDDLRVMAQRPRVANEKELVLFATGNVIQQSMEEGHMGHFVVVRDGEDRWLIVVQSEQAGDEQGQPVAAAEMASLLINRINTYVKVKLSIGCSFPVRDLRLVKSAYQHAEQMLQQKGLLGGNRVFAASEEEEHAPQAEIKLNDPDEMMDLLKFGTPEELAEGMDKFPELVRLWGMKSIREIRQQTFEWLHQLFKRAEEAGAQDRWWDGQLIQIWEDLDSYDTVESLRAGAEAYLSKLAETPGLRKSSQNQLMAASEQYIRSNYAQNLTLQSVAEQVHVTQVWLSKLFKKERDQTFLEFLTEVRMTQAKELLADVKYRVYQVSQEVGYKDPVYFTKLFKKSTGYTPKEYRNLKGLSDE
ncbi:response regulator [Paenibacillus sp. GCM10023252]|uniref:response regulator n=1 Tax=Paenibacillus sp. GCM10023252 TaxID=3252649 RepID=UPI00360B11F3